VSFSCNSGGRTVEKISGTQEQICEKVSKIIAGNNIDTVAVFLYITNIHCNLINVIAIRSFDVFLMKYHMKKLEKEQKRFILNHKIVKHNGEKLLLLNSCDVSDLSKSILNTLKNSKVTLRKINFLQESITEGIETKVKDTAEGTAWKCLVFSNNNIWNIAVKFKQQMVLLRELANFSNDITVLSEEIAQTCQYIRKVGYHGDDISIYLPDKLDIEKDRLAGLVADVIKCGVNIYSFAEDEAPETTLISSQQHSSLFCKHFWIPTFLRAGSAAFFVLCVLFSAKNLYYMHKEIHFQWELMQTNPNLRDLPLPTADFEEIKRVAWLESIVLTLWKSRTAQSWGAYNFFPLFNTLFPNIHKNNFLIKAECKIVTQKSKKKSKESLFFEATVSPAIFYKEKIDKLRAKDILTKSKNYIKSDLLLCLEKKPSQHEIKINTKSDNTICVKVSLLVPDKAPQAENLQSFFNQQRRRD
jgi:hypothetical protein